MGKECVIPPITFPKSVLIGGFVGLMESIMWICFALCFLTLEKAKGLVESEDSDKFWRYFFNNLHAEEGDRDMMIHYVMLVYLIVSTIWGLLSIFMLIQRGRHVPPCCTYKWLRRSYLAWSLCTLLICLMDLTLVVMFGVKLLTDLGGGEEDNSKESRSIHDATMIPGVYSKNSYIRDSGQYDVVSQRTASLLAKTIIVTYISRAIILWVTNLATGAIVLNAYCQSLKEDCAAVDNTTN